MQRIKAVDNAVLDNGKYKFTTSNPPFPNTTITADWLNSMQEEIANVIESAGIALDDTKKDQLNTALSQLNGIVSNTTLTVNGSAPYPNLAAAFEYLRKRTILPGVTVTIQMATGMVHTHSAEVKVTNRQGDQIQILGDLVTPVVIKVVPTAFTREQAALSLTNGGRIGLISGVQFSYDTPNATTLPIFAVKVGMGCSLTFGNKADIINFRGCGLVVEDGGIVTATQSQARLTVVTGLSANDQLVYGHGFWARRKGRLIVEACLSSGNIGDGIRAETGASVTVNNCTNFLNGIGSYSGATVYATNCILNGSAADTRYAYGAADCGSLTAVNCVGGISGTFYRNIFYCGRSSRMSLFSCEAKYAYLSGMLAELGSDLHADNTSSHHNAASGYETATNGRINIANGANSYNNTGWGYDAGNYSVICGGTLVGSANGSALKRSQGAALLSGVA